MISAHSNGNSLSSTPSCKPQPPAPKVRKSMSSRIHEAAKAIVLCHNVTPVYESCVNGASTEPESTEAGQDFSDNNHTYQSTSPDEVILMGRPERNCIYLNHLVICLIKIISKILFGEFICHFYFIICHFLLEW